MQPWEHGTTFTAFVNDRLQWTTDRVHEIRYRQLRRTLPMPTPLPIDAARSGSVGGKHIKGKVARKNANTVPVQGGNKVKKICLTKCVPNPLSSIQKLYENLKEKLKELKCHKYVITNPYRYLYCCPEHYDVSYFGNILRAQNAANSCLTKTLKEAAITLKIEKLVGLSCKETRIIEN